MLTAAEATFKAVLESDAMVTRFIVTESTATRPLLKVLRRDEIREMLRRHRLVDRIVDDAGRALELARWEACDGRRIVVIATGATAVSGIRTLERLAAGTFDDAEAVAVLREDPGGSLEIRPRIASAGLPMIEASGVGHVRDSIEYALRLSRGARRPCVIVAEREIFRAAARASPSLAISPSVPGVTGTPYLVAVARAVFLSPMARINSAEGPMNLILQLSQISAKRGFSERNP